MTDDRANPPDTADPGYRPIRGRRWRISDPSIPEALRQSLVDELMAARRAVGTARRASDAAAERRARSRVQDAKVALGERGPRWWLALDADDHRVRAVAACRALLRSRDAAASLRAGEVARVIDGGAWRRRLALARRVLLEGCAEGELAPRSRGGAGREPLRVGRGPRFPAPP